MSVLEISHRVPSEMWYIGRARRLISTVSGLLRPFGGSSLPPAAGPLELQPGRSRQICSHSRPPRPTLWAGISGPQWPRWTIQLLSESCVGWQTWMIVYIYGRFGKSQVGRGQWTATNLTLIWTSEVNLSNAAWAARARNASVAVNLIDIWYLFYLSF